MGIFRQFPYSNFHDLNLDWLLGEIKRLSMEWLETKENLEKWVEDTDDAFKNLQDYVMNYFENLDVQEEINNKLNDMVASGEFEAIVKPYLDKMTNRRVLLIGDSYNTGTGGGQSITTMAPYIARKLNIPQNHVYNYSVGGAGFIRTPSDAGGSFEKNLDSAIAGLTEDEKKHITDITVIGGANDAEATHTALMTNIEAFALKAKANFPNAKLWIFAVGWSTEPENRRKLMTAYKYYSFTNHFNVVKLYHHLQNKAYMYENWHPNTDGVITLGRFIGGILNGATDGIQSTEPILEYMYVGNGTDRIYLRTWCDLKNVYLQFNGTPATSNNQVVVTYDVTKLGEAYMSYIYGYVESDDKTWKDHSVNVLAVDNDNYMMNETLRFSFYARGDRLANKTIDVYARSYRTVNGVLANTPIKRLYITSDVIVIPIWEA